MNIDFSNKGLFPEGEALAEAKMKFHPNFRSDKFNQEGHDFVSWAKKAKIPWRTSNDHPMSEEQVNIIRRLLMSNVYYKFISQAMGVSYHTVCAIRHGRTWADVEYSPVNLTKIMENRQIEIDEFDRQMTRAEAEAKTTDFCFVLYSDGKGVLFDSNIRNVILEPCDNEHAARIHLIKMLGTETAFKLEVKRL